MLNLLQFTLECFNLPFSGVVQCFLHADVVPELVVGTHFGWRVSGYFHYFQSLAYLGVLQQLDGSLQCLGVDFCEKAKPKHLHLLFAERMWLEFLQLDEYEVKAVNHFVCMLVVDEVVVMIVVVHVLLEILVDEV